MREDLDRQAGEGTWAERLHRQRWGSETESDKGDSEQLAGWTGRLLRMVGRRLAGETKETVGDQDEDFFFKQWGVHGDFD